MVDVVQLVEHRIVVPSVVGSSPIIHPQVTTFGSIRGLFGFSGVRHKCNPMKTKKSGQARILLLISLLLNCFLLVVILVGERSGHAYRAALVRRGIVAYDDTKTAGYWTKLGWTNTLQKMNIACDAVFFGSSSTRGSDFQLTFPDLSIVNLGLAGDNLPGMLYRIDMVKAVHPKKVFLMAGTNDLFHTSIEQFSESYETLLMSLHENLPDAKVYLESLLPINHALKPSAPSHETLSSANEAIRQIAEKYGCTFIDLYERYVQEGELPKDLTRDGIHLKPEAYGIWAEAIKDYLYE